MKFSHIICMPATRMTGASHDPRHHKVSCVCNLVTWKGVHCCTQTLLVVNHVCNSIAGTPRLFAPSLGT